MTMASPKPYAAPPAQPPKRVGIYPGAGNRDMTLMQGANAKVKRNPDGSASDGQASGAGAYGDSQGQSAAWPASPEAFPTEAT